jgi:hypothetical protein
LNYDGNVNLPTSVPLATAASLAGLSAETFKSQAIRSGAIILDFDRRVPLGELARWLDRPLNADDILSAQNRLESTRVKAKLAQRNRRVGRGR